MYPVLLSFGNFPISSFGVLLAAGIFLGSFTVWRIARGYELDAEKILDVVFLTLGAGFITARAFFVLTNLTIFDNWSKVFFLSRYPGFSFWGGFIGSIFALNWLSKKFKIPYLQAGDFAIVGFFFGAFVAELGCLLGSCGIGVETKLFIGVDQIGAIGKRFPVQLFESAGFLVSFLVFWKAILRFNIQGDLFSKGLIVVSLIKLSALVFKAGNSTTKMFGLSLNLEAVLAVLVLIYGLKLYYQVNKKTPLYDLALIYKLFSDRKKQSQVVTKISKGWYNHWVNLRVGLVKAKKRIFKLLNIRSNPESF